MNERGESMAINLKKFTIAMVGLIAFFVCMPTTHALEEVQTQNTITEDTTVEDTSKWEVTQPERKVTSEGLIIDYNFDNLDAFIGNDGWIVEESYVTVTITIPEDYELDSIVIAPDVFQEIADCLYAYFKKEYNNFEMNNAIHAGDKLGVNFVINNLSKYTYNYDETSFEVFPKNDIVYNKKEESTTTTPTEDAPLFNGETVNENYHFRRTYNTALKALIPDSKGSQMTDEAIDVALKKAGYENGINDYTQYLLDFYNKKYHTNYTRLDQFPDGIIREILGENDPFVVTNAAANDAYKAAGVTFISRNDTAESILKTINKNTGKNYQSLEEYVLEYYNKKYNTDAERLVDLCDEALDNFFLIHGSETGRYEYVYETNPDVIALSYDYFYNKGLAWGFEDDEYSHDDSEDFAIGEYMRDEAKGDEYIKENAGTLISNGSGKVNGTLYTSGSYILDCYLGYEFNVDMQWTYSALKGTVIAQYVDIYGNVLADDVITTDMVGKDYQTYLKEFDGYQLIRIDGDEIGKYIDGKIVVVYIYAPRIPEDNPKDNPEDILDLGTGSTDGWEITPPKTGVSNDSSVVSQLFVMLLTLGSASFVILKK